MVTLSNFFLSPPGQVFLKLQVTIEMTGLFRGAEAQRGEKISREFDTRIYLCNSRLYPHQTFINLEILPSKVNLLRYFAQLQVFSFTFII